MLLPENITGLVLAGGEGRRMGGVDKGLQLWHGQPLAQRACQRLQPQVGSLLISANRHLDVYGAWGWPVIVDERVDGRLDFQGPLAGLLAGLRHAQTPWLVSVPCDVPLFPTDLVAHLAQHASPHTPDTVIMARSPERIHPVFCLLPTALAQDLQNFLDRGERQVQRWMRRHATIEVGFEPPDCFRNLNVCDDLNAGDAMSPQA
ncbi:molybdenum cofactor guanylyltransferase MobA [Leptothrix ochracea]|uniref:molybdenum cofactor guanylyltransferase MobA n=1 Tax=Leptothrix ochracea TaxID=735331 RepID=UPI0034E2F79D